MSAPLVVRVGPPGNYATVWIQDGVGYVLEGGKWQPLTDAPGLGGWVLSASKVAEVVAEYGSPVAASEPSAPVPTCMEPGCTNPIAVRESARRCALHFRQWVESVRAEEAEFSRRPRLPERGPRIKVTP